MRVLVTGGAGYIGSVTARQLLEAGHEVTVFDNLVTGHRAAVPEAARFVQGDLHDPAALAGVMAEARYDAVVHFAAFIEAGESMVDPGRYFHNNVAGSQALIEAACNHDAGRFVFSSTAAVYAGKDAPLSETDPLAPANAYGASKLMVEQILDWYRRIKGLRVAVLRYFNAAGASGSRGEAHRPETHLIPIVLQAAMGRRQHVSIYGSDYPTPDGTCVRDYIHIADLADAHVRALDALEEQRSLTCNLGNGEGYSVRQVIETARAVTGRAIPVREDPRRPGDAAVLVADASLARQMLGWQPKRPALNDIIASAWEWHTAHPKGYGGQDA